MRVLLDTNVVLDALLERHPWVAEARQIWQFHLHGDVDAHITASSLTDIFYVSRKHAGLEKAWQAVDACLDQLHVIPITVRQLQAAMTFAGNDFEDNLQIACAVAASLDVIVTRDPADFSASPVRVLTPPQLLADLAAGPGPTPAPGPIGPA